MALRSLHKITSNTTATKLNYCLRTLSEHGNHEETSSWLGLSHRRFESNRQMDDDELDEKDTRSNFFRDVEGRRKRIRDIVDTVYKNREERLQRNLRPSPRSFMQSLKKKTPIKSTDWINRNEGEERESVSNEHLWSQRFARFHEEEDGSPSPPPTYFHQEELDTDRKVPAQAQNIRLLEQKSHVHWTSARDRDFDVDPLVEAFNRRKQELIQEAAHSVPSPPAVGRNQFDFLKSMMADDDIAEDEWQRKDLDFIFHNTEDNGTNENGHIDMPESYHRPPPTTPNPLKESHVLVATSKNPPSLGRPPIPSPTNQNISTPKSSTTHPLTVPKKESTLITATTRKPPLLRLIPSPNKKQDTLLMATSAKDDSMLQKLLKRIRGEVSEQSKNDWRNIDNKRIQDDEIKEERPLDDVDQFHSLLAHAKWNGAFEEEARRVMPVKGGGEEQPLPLQSGLKSSEDVPVHIEKMQDESTMHKYGQEQLEPVAIPLPPPETVKEPPPTQFHSEYYTSQLAQIESITTLLDQLIEKNRGRNKIDPTVDQVVDQLHHVLNRDRGADEMKRFNVQFQVKRVTASLPTCVDEVDCINTQYPGEFLDTPYMELKGKVPLRRKSRKTDRAFRRNDGDDSLSQSPAKDVSPTTFFRNGCKPINFYIKHRQVSNGSRSTGRKNPFVQRQRLPSKDQWDN